MASTNWKKCKTGEAKAIIRHNDTQERLLHEHDNQEIDRILTPHNVDLIPGGYAGACKRLDDRLASLDAAPGARNKRKDRVIMVSLETAVPAGIAGDRDKEDAWAADYLELVKSRFGPENVVCGYLHRDEQHEYIDTDGVTQMSRAHVHVGVVPVVEGRLNARALVTREAMVGLNDEVEDMTKTKDKYNCHYLTGKGRKGRSRSVEELKSATFGRAVELGALELMEDLEAAREADRQAALDEMSEIGAELCLARQATNEAKLQADRAKRLADKQQAAWVDALMAKGDVENLRTRLEDLRSKWETEVRALTPEPEPEPEPKRRLFGSRGARPSRKPPERPQSPQEVAARAKAQPLQRATREALEDHTGAAARVLAQMDERETRRSTDDFSLSR